jgi:hypothetical protein
MNRSSVAAGVSPAVEGGVSPPGFPGSWSPCAIRESWRLPMNLPSPRHRTPHPNRNPPASTGSWTQCAIRESWVLSMNPASVAAGVSPAVEGGILPPGIPGSWTQCAISESWRLSMNRSSVAAGVPPAVEGGVSPPGIPGSRSVSRLISERQLLPTRRLPRRLSEKSAHPGTVHPKTRSTSP